MVMSTPANQEDDLHIGGKRDQTSNITENDTNTSNQPLFQVEETNWLHTFSTAEVQTDPAIAMVIEAHEKTMASADSSEKANPQPTAEQREHGNQKSPQEKVPSSPLVTPPMNSSASPKSPRTSSLLPHASSSAAASDETQKTAQHEGVAQQKMEGDSTHETPPGSASATHGFYTEYAKALPFGYVDAALSRDSQGALQTPPNVAAAEPPAKKLAVATKGNKPKGVPHVYHDYSRVSGPGPTYVRKKSGGVTTPFPEKLHEMLDHESSDDPSSGIVSWMPHGRAFIVRRPKEFTSQIMPRYFRQTKLTSFQRQLNLYGFRRITQGADSGAYYHELFLQGRPSLSQRMVRQKVKGTGHKQPADVSSEPNFYAMPPVEAEHPPEAFAGTGYKPSVLPPGASAVIPSSVPAATANAAAAAINPPHSPGMAAANVLRGFATSNFAASGGAAAATAFLGASAVDGGVLGEESHSDEKSPTGTPASFLPPPRDNAAV